MEEKQKLEKEILEKQKLEANKLEKLKLDAENRNLKKNLRRRGNKKKF